MAGKFEIYKDKAGEFRFRLKAANGQTILASEGYKARSGCANGVESVRKNAQNDARYERKTTESGKFRFNLKSGNNQIIGASESYETEKARDNGMESVKKNAPDAAVLDITDLSKEATH
ncbi:MAG TPA: YegP family protein [Nitrosospira sp.]|nr:YegP family protein [Nitrosospira sp.]